MNKKILAGAGVLMAAATFATVLVASAQTVSAQGTSNPSDVLASTHMVLDIGPKGHVFMRGTIASVSGSVITVNSWGGTWTVNLDSSTKVLPKNGSTSLAQFKTGDFIGVSGMVSGTSNMTVNASVVRDRNLAGQKNPSPNASN